jgi:hypothetical protein
MLSFVQTIDKSFSAVLGSSERQALPLSGKNVKQSKL